MKRKLAAIATTFFVACLAAGCGGDDKPASGGSAGTTTSSNGPVTKAAFITAADAVCTQTTAKIRAAGAKLRAASEKSGTLPKTEVVRFFQQTSLPAYDAMVGKLGELTPPKGDVARVDGFVATLAAAIDVVKANPAKFASPAAADPFDDFNKRAQDYGMKACGA